MKKEVEEKIESVIWGIGLILAAIGLIIRKLGYFNNIHIDMWSIICSIILVVCLARSLVSINFSGILFSIALLCIVHAEYLGIESLTPWTLLGAAALGSAGLSMLFPRKSLKKNKSKKKDKDKEHFNRVVDEVDGKHVKCNVHFNSEVKYVNTDCLKTADIECHFGAAKVYFDHASLKSDSATINIEASFAGVEIYVPQTWKVVNYIKPSFGAIEEHGTGSMLPNAPEVSICGEVSFSGISIIYV